jgi:SlyX protein
MNDIKKQGAEIADPNRLAKNLLEDRIDALEARLTFQDEAIETLNNTITAQWNQIDSLTRQIAKLNERLAEAEAEAHTPRGETELPPHY